MKFEKSNLDVINAIRNESSELFKGQVPVATNENLEEVGAAITTYSHTMNEFLTALVNRIAVEVIRSGKAQNPLAQFKKGQLAYGKDVEEIFVGIAEAQTYDATTAETELYKRVIPDVKAIFHRINREEFYKTTIQKAHIKRAFVEEGGMADLVNRILASLYEGDLQDEFIKMKELMKEYNTGNKFKKVAIAQGAAAGEFDPRDLTIALKATSNKFTFMSSAYNAQAVKTSCPKERQVLIMTADVDALVDVAVLAAAFNMSKAEFMGQRVVIDAFPAGMENVVAILVDRDWFMVYDTLLTGESVSNAQGLYSNFFLHHHQILSTSEFSNAVKFEITAA